MKKLFTTATFIVFLFTQLTAQEFPWNAYFGGGGAEFATDIHQTSDNGYIISGYGGDGNSTNYYVIKIDMFGDLQWERNINKDNYSEKAYSILETAEGEFIVVGSATSGNKPWIVKLDGSGETIWTSSWTDNLPANSALLARGTLLSDGRIVVIGASGSYGYQPNMLIISAEGELLEQRTLNAIVPPGWLSGTFVNHVEATSDGGFILTGSAGSGTASRAYLWKFDQNADSSWSAHYTGQNSWMRIAESVKELSDGGYILSGSDSPNAINSCAIRTDAQGNLLWYQSYPDSIYTQATDIIEWQNGQFLMTEKRFDGIGTSFYQSSMLTLDSQGNMLSRELIMASDSSTTITNMRKTNDGGFVLAGEINEYLAVNEQDLFVLKSDALGNISGVMLDYVWPGDVNYDGFVDMDDLMILGITAGATGPSRWNATTEWTPQYVTDWADTVVTGVNFKHADTDGNGLVDILDTLAIVMNYGQTRNAEKSNTQRSKVGNDLYVNPLEVMLINNQQVQIPLYLGSTANLINNLYGLRFSLEIDEEILMGETVKIDFNNTWLGQLNVDTWAIHQHQAENGTTDFGITRADQTMASGGGLLGMINFTLNEPLEAGETINFNLSLSNLKAHSIDLDPIELLSDTYEISIVNSLTGVSNPLKQAVEIFPNPSNGLFTIKNLRPGMEIKLFTLSSVLVLNQRVTSVEEQISLNTPGVYIIELKENESVLRKKLIVQ